MERYRVRNVALNIMMVCVSIILGMVLIDTSFRFFANVAPRSGTLSPKAKRISLTPITSVLDPNYSGVLKARDFEVSVRANAKGFRGRDLDDMETRTLKPYFLTGDSYLFGWGVEVPKRMGERFAELLKAEAPAIGAPIVNFSFPGFGTYQYLDVMRMFAVKYNPRLIIIGFFVGNDFLDDQNTLLAQQAYRDGSSPPSLQYMTDERVTIRSLLRTSPIVNLFQYNMWRFAWFRDIFNRMEIRNDRLVLFARAASPRQEALYADSFREFDEIAKFSSESKIPVLVMIIPGHLQVLSKEIFTEGEYDIGKPQRMVKNCLDRRGIPYLDLLPYFNKEKDPGNLFFREDKHWSVKGNNFVARILTDYMISRKTSPAVMN